MKIFWTHRFKPCPFCGCSRIELLPQSAATWLVRCSMCRASKLVISQFRFQALAEWNQRIPLENT
jgi:hypothetical protein